MLDTQARQRNNPANFSRITTRKSSWGTVQYLPGWTVQCINPDCQARGHWLRADATRSDMCSNCGAPLHNVPPPLGPRLRLRPRSLGHYRPPGRPR